MTVTNLATVSNGVAALWLAVWAALAYLAWYDRFSWWDDLAHLAAGFTIGGFAAAHPWPIRAILVALLLGVLWELFEYVRGIWPWMPRVSLPLSWEDTKLDMALVLLGASWAALVVYAT